jgi:hypothetical protein
VALTIVLYPEKLFSLRKWVNQNARLLIDKKIHLPETTYSNDFDHSTKNVRVVMVREGNEEVALKSLADSQIAIDAKFQPLPLGPESLIIDFYGSASPLVSNQASMIQKIKDIFQSVFPKLSGTDLSVSVERGTRYLVSIMAPANRLDEKVDFADRWLITKIAFVFSRNLASGSNYVDRLFVEIPDGFLPKWPPDAKYGPSVINYRQFHLSAEGDGVTQNFQILDDIQSQLKDAFVQKYDGTALE